MIKSPGTDFDDESHEVMLAVFIGLKLVVSGSDAVKPYAVHGSLETVIESDGRCGIAFEALRDERSIGFRDYEARSGIGLKEGCQRLLVEVVRVIVTGSDDVDTLEFARIDDLLGHSRMRFVRDSVFSSEGVRKVGIE